MQYNIVSAYRWYSSNMFLVLSHDILSTVVSLFHYSRQGFVFHAHSLSPYQNHGPVFHLRQVQHTCKTQNAPHLNNTLAAPLSPLGCTKITHYMRARNRVDHLFNLFYFLYLLCPFFLFCVFGWFRLFLSVVFVLYAIPSCFLCFICEHYLPVLPFC